MSLFTKLKDCVLVLRGQYSSEMFDRVIDLHEQTLSELHKVPQSTAWREAIKPVVDQCRLAVLLRYEIVYKPPGAKALADTLTNMAFALDVAHERLTKLAEKQAAR